MVTSKRELPSFPHVYRPDIDGLRTIAVVAVVLFHAFPHFIFGGFLGVDVFFVISGYLISGLILRAIKQDKFSIREFYVRRIKRIFPALIVVMVFVLCAGWISFSASEYKLLAKQVLAGAGFLANLSFWRESGYFDVSAEDKPLLHLWSLGIEEQFYILWPLCMVWLFKRRETLIRWTSIIFLTSLLFGIIASYRFPVANFYLPVTRAWELLAGALVAELEFDQFRFKSKSQKECASAVGLILILLSVFIITPSLHFPGWRALFPVFGTVLVIMGGESSWANRFVLSTRPMVFVGLISYPLYLWHWPILSILHLTIGDRSTNAIKGLALVVSALLAVLTFRAIERPVQSGQIRVPIVSLLIGLMCAVSALAAIIYLQGGIAERFPLAVRSLASEIDFRWSENVRLGQCHIQDPDSSSRDPRCVEEQRPLVFLWGDSNASSLYPGLKKLQSARHFGIAQMTQAGCPPVVDVPELLYKKNCNELNSKVFEEATKLRPAVIVLHSAWQHFHYPMSDSQLRDRLQGMLKRLNESVPDSKIVVIGPMPRWNGSPQKELLSSWKASFDKLSPIPAYQTATQLFDLETALKQTALKYGAHFVSALNHLCQDTRCLAYVGPQPTDIIATDPTHLSKAGSEYFINQIRDAFP